MSEFERQGRTDHLDLILQAISTAYLTGVLHVERGKGGVREGGDIAVSRGQVVRATTGSRQGDEALEWLLTWGNCQYRFQEEFPTELFSSPSSSISLPVTPIPDMPATAPLKYASESLNQNILRAFGSGTEKRSVPVTGPVTGPDYAPLPTHLTPVPRQRGQQQEPTGFRQSPPVPPARAPGPPAVHVAIRVQDGPPALTVLDRFKLSRIHRHVFLLLDGKRTSRDLERLTGHPLGDVERLLADLVRVGLVRWIR